MPLAENIRIIGNQLEIFIVMTEIAKTTHLDVVFRSW